MVDYKEMIEFETATTVYKSLHGFAPEYTQLMFTKLSENGSRATQFVISRCECVE